MRCARTTSRDCVFCFALILDAFYYTSPSTGLQAAFRRSIPIHRLFLMLIYFPPHPLLPGFVV